MQVYFPCRPPFHFSDNILQSVFSSNLQEPMNVIRHDNVRPIAAKAFNRALIELTDDNLS